MSSLIGNILLVDDDEILLDTINEILELEGYNVFTASNPYEAINLVKDEKIDLALLDYNLPYMNGVELGNLLDKSQKNIKIMVISGNPTIKELMQNVDYYVYEVLPKPINLGILLNRINEIIDKKYDENNLVLTSIIII